MTKEQRLQHFPIGYFSMILGLGGFTLASQRIEELFAMPAIIPQIIQILTISIFAVLLVGYIAKLIKFPNAVKAEFCHPVKIAFFPAISISFLLLSSTFLQQNLLVSKYLWIIGTVLHLLFTFKVVNTWMHHSKFEINHMNPAWFIPAVGNIIVPLSGVEHASPEISWFFFSVGFVFWVILMVIFFNRIIFHDPLPEKLLPTLFILIAPPIVGFVAYTKLTGDLSEFGKILYYIGLFFTILLLSQVRMFSKVKFYLSSWAYMFPLAAATIASILMHNLTHIHGFKIIAMILYIMIAVLFLVLIFRTAVAVIRNEIRVQE